MLFPLNIWNYNPLAVWLEFDINQIAIKPAACFKEHHFYLLQPES